ncbi:response regulator [Neorhizobium galegae]|uniref:response regulator n=1 Tax=Neorhizobium galegae TaxID=399 RepID=UPI0021050CCC|nr:response regulator [Neorhizobium galegae]MCQ1769154.1 response regulator [Neorhizobium galegae]MCQ1846319.1 response regulator [Neorhizobium galegae]
MLRQQEHVLGWRVAPPDPDDIGARMPQTSILVIEDEPLIRMSIADELRDVGFVVLEAVNAEEALRLLSKERLIRAIFTDIELHGELDGLNLARMVKERWPLIEIIITSGNRNVAANEMPERSLFFPKPYAPSAIIDALKRITG